MIKTGATGHCYRRGQQGLREIIKIIDDGIKNTALEKLKLLERCGLLDHICILRIENESWIRYHCNLIHYGFKIAQICFLPAFLKHRTCSR